MERPGKILRKRKEMKKKQILTFALGATLALSLAALPAFAQQKENEKNGKAESAMWPPSAPKAKITPVQAISIAKKVLGGGTAFQANFEFDEGHWVYGVLIVKGHKISEVEVDPTTGKSMGTEAVTVADEVQEMKETLTKVAAAGG